MRLLLITMSLLVAPMLAQSPPVAEFITAKPGVVFVDLAYPTEALAARVTGVVVVQASIDDAGHVVGAESLLGPEVLAQAALVNVRQWTFTAAARQEVVVYRFEIDQHICNDDSRSLFRLAHSNFALITACTGPGRAFPRSMPDELELASWGDPRVVYAPIAQSARMTGLVVLELTLDSTGAVVESRPLSKVPLVTEAAVAHSKTWRFRPSERRRGIIVYEFALDKWNCDVEPVEFRHIDGNFWQLNTCGMLIQI